MDAAKELIAAAGVAPLRGIVTPKVAAEALMMNDQSASMLPENVERADLFEPVIFVIVTVDGRREHLLIDGWHRLAKMMRDQVQTPLDAYVVPEQLAKTLIVKGV